MNAPSTLLRHAFALCAALTVVLHSIATFAAQPPRFNYQAKLTDASGDPLQGTQTLFISLWSGGSSGSANSGTQFFAEQAVVTANNGVVNHVVGTGLNVFGGPLTDAMFAPSSDIYLQVGVGVAGNVVLPRARLESVPFAITARTAENGVPAGFMVVGTSNVAPAGYTATGSALPSNWLLRTSLPSARYNVGAAVAGGKIYGVGGVGAGAVYEDDNEKYDPLLNSWASRTPLPVARAGFSFNELNGLLYVVGGVTTATSAANFLNEAYNPGTNSWSLRASLNTARMVHASAVAGGKIYVFGGATDNGAPALIASVEAYDPATNNWVFKMPMPTPRYYAQAAEVGGIVYVIGGIAGTVTGVNEAYNPALNTWETRAPLPVALAATAAVAHDNRIYVIGGINAANEAAASVWIYDPTANTWVEGPPMTRARGLVAAAVANDHIYAIGGSEDFIEPISLNEMLNPTTYYLFTKN